MTKRWIRFGVIALIIWLAIGTTVVFTGRNISYFFTFLAIALMVVGHFVALSFKLEGESDVLAILNLIVTGITIILEDMQGVSKLLVLIQNNTAIFGIAIVLLALSSPIVELIGKWRNRSSIMLREMHEHDIESLGRSGPESRLPDQAKKKDKDPYGYMKTMKDHMIPNFLGAVVVVFLIVLVMHVFTIQNFVPLQGGGVDTVASIFFQLSAIIVLGFCSWQQNRPDSEKGDDIDKNPSLKNPEQSLNVAWLTIALFLAIICVFFSFSFALCNSAYSEWYIVTAFVAVSGFLIFVSLQNSSMAYWLFISAFPCVVLAMGLWLFSLKALFGVAGLILIGIFFALLIRVIMLLRKTPLGKADKNLWSSLVPPALFYLLLFSSMVSYAQNILWKV